MTTICAVFLFLIGLILIVKGGDLFVDASSWIAEVSGIPKFVIGATIVSLATTLPEIIVSSIAAYNGKYDIAVGNSIGSVTANLGLIMGISIVFMPFYIKRSRIMFKGLLMLFSCIALAYLSNDGIFKISDAIFLLLLFGIFVWENIREAKNSIVPVSDDKKATSKTVGINLFKFAIGATGIVIGADLLVDNGSCLARIMNIPESIIAVTIIAIGTSLPELATTLTAISKKQSSLSIGNIIGANIIDLTLILPICTLISKGQINISRQTILLDYPAFLIIGAIGILPTIVFKHFYKFQGICMLLAYGLYLAILCTGIVV